MEITTPDEMKTLEEFVTKTTDIVSIKINQFPIICADWFHTGRPLVTLNF
jgi:hypothetical protein